MRFDASLLEEIKDRIPISTVVGRRVTWDRRKSQPRKGDHWACCPFHSEKSPSFHADDRRGRYHCFGCGASGDHFTFLVERDGLSFPDAVATLAAEAGVALPAPDARSAEREEKRRSLHDVIEAATLFYEAALLAPEGEKARRVLASRDLGQARARFRLGYAPSARAALKEHLAAKGFTQDEMVEAGLLVAGDDIAVSYDRFRDRLIFPIRDGRGRVVAFGGRALSDDQKAKYLNSPETPLFSKGRLLYNLDGARAAKADKGRLVVVEGYVDAIRAIIAGFPATVAPLGTALTDEQLQLLWGMSDEPILCFDGDEAGLKAAWRAVDLALPLLEPGKSLRFALLPAGQDPDDFLRDNGAGAFSTLLDEAEPLAEMLWRRERLAQPLDTPEAQAGFEKRLYGLVAQIRDENVLRRYRAHMRLRLAALFDPFRAERRGQAARPAGPVVSDARLKQGRLERMILGFCVEFPFLLADFVEEVSGATFENKDYRAFADGLHQLYVDHGDVDVTLIYLKLGRRFFAVLDEVHGHGAELVELHDPARGRRVAGRGHRLKTIFPKLALNPPEDLVWATMAHLLHKLELREFERRFASIAADLVGPEGGAEEGEGGDEPDRKVAALFAQLQEKRRRVGEGESDLDLSYQALSGAIGVPAAV